MDRSRDIFQPGEVLAENYEIRSLLGAGGMGQVFEAHDRALDRLVAVKAAWPGLPGPPLRNEAKALAAFRHPSLVTVHTLGQHRDTDYIVMERVYGVSLAELLHQKRMASERFEPRIVLEMMTAIAEGLAVVHRAGIAHRDIKPSNFMSTPDGRIVIMDFGLFLPEFDMATQDSIAGSPPYMAPEALANVLEPGSGQLVDIFALGVTTYELLTDRLPFNGSTLEDLWEAQKRVVPDVRKYRPDVSDEFADLIREMLHRDAAARPQSAEALAWQLKRLSPDHKRKAAAKPVTKVLIVDDDRDIARVMGFYAKRALGEVELFEANDGEAALEMAAKHEPDVMLLDLHMPKMNGIEVCMYLRGSKMADNCKIISVSAGAQHHDKQLLFQLGITHFVEKGPKMGEKLTETLRTATGRASVIEG